MAVTGEVIHKRKRERFVVGEVAGVGDGSVCRENAMSRGSATNPVIAFAAKVDIERFGTMDVAGPEEADVAIAESGFAGGDLDGERDGSVGETFIALARFEGMVEGWGLVELDGVFVNHP